MSLFHGLVGWWRMDDGLAPDLSGNGFHGTVFGATAAANRHRKTTGALSFDGVDNYVSVSDYPALNPSGVNAFSLAVWAHVATTNAGYTRGFVAKNASSTATGYALGEYNKKWAFFVSGTVLQPVATYNFRQWYHVTGVFNGTQYLIYENGVLVAGPANATYAADAADVLIGRWFRDADARRHFNGRLDDVRFYNRALSAIEILAIYEQNPSQMPRAKVTGARVFYFPRSLNV